MNRRERRAFRRQYETQINEERRGAPIPGEIAALMTKPKAPDRLYQAVVETADGKTILVGPATPNEGAIGAFVEAVNRAVLAGVEKTWRKAEVIEHLAIPH
jgi:hypothetical protein